MDHSPWACGFILPSPSALQAEASPSLGGMRALGPPAGGFCGGTWGAEAETARADSTCHAVLSPSPLPGQEEGTARGGRQELGQVQRSLL